VQKRHHRHRVATLILCLVASACGSPQGLPKDAASAAGGPAANRAIIVTAHPQATEAGLAMLRQGGSAMDAAIAAQAVLGLVEPQSSGLLGGSLILLALPGQSDIVSIDGMPTAPAAATRAVSLTQEGELLDPREVAASARAVGVPGILPALWAAHQKAGKLPWASLFAPAIRLARDGIAMPRQLHGLLAGPGMIEALGDVAAPYLAPNGSLLAEGATFRNPDAARALDRVARMGPEGLWQDGGMAEALESLGQGRHRSWITEADLISARPNIGAALCVSYQALRLCTAAPPSMGGMVMLQTLLTVPPGDPADPAFMHRFIEASRLAQADRRRYLADPAFVPVPVTALLDSAYLASRAGLIQADRTIGRPQAGQVADEARAADPGSPKAGTSQIVAADANGLVVSMTSTVTLQFGARRGAFGMVFNNALINFAPPPPTTFADQNDHYANEMEPGKRPLTPATPVIVTGPDGVVLAGGGAGGIPIPDTVALAVMDILTNHRSLPSVLAAGHVHAADPDHIVLEDGTDAVALQAPLERAGHRVGLETVSTGNAFITHDGKGWHGAADPRRDGTAQGLP